MGVTKNEMDQCGAMSVDETPDDVDRNKWNEAIAQSLKEAEEDEELAKALAKALADSLAEENKRKLLAAAEAAKRDKVLKRIVAASRLEAKRRARAVALGKKKVAEATAVSSEDDEFAQAIKASLEIAAPRLTMRVGSLPELGVDVEFDVKHNNGGGGNHCGPISLRDVAHCTAEFPYDLKKFFDRKPIEFRKELIRMVKSADPDIQSSMVCQYLDVDVDPMTPLDDTTRPLLEAALMKEKLCWDTLVWYVENKTDRVCLVLWRELEHNGKLIYQPDGSMHHGKFMVHIVHYINDHYEALVPRDSEKAALAIRSL